MKKVVIALIIIVILGVGGVVLLGGKKDNSTSTTSNTVPSTSNDNTPAAATVTYTNSGFQPALSTIKAGQTIKFINNSDNELQLDSNPHPVHTDEPELNVGVIAKGDSRTVTLTKQGTWGFHNHLNATDSAKVEVQ